MSGRPSDNAAGELISPWDQRIYKIPLAEHDRYKQAGWAVPADTDAQQVHNAFSGWREMGGAESAIYSASAGWLGLPSLIEKGAHALGHDDWAKNYADHVIAAAEQHPNIDLAARLTTGIGSAGLYAAGATAAAPAVLGAAGLGAAGAGVAELAGAAGAAGEAAAAAEAGLPAASSIAGNVARLGGKLAAEGAAIGIVDRYDQAAIQHAASPEGQEKIVWSLADIARDAAINGTVGLGLTGAAKAIGALGRRLGDASTNKLVESLLNRQSAEQVAMQGRDGELRRLAKEIIPLGVERGRTHVDNIIDVAEKDMNQLKYQIEGKGNWLDDTAVRALKKQVDEQLGGTVEGARITKMIEDASGETERAATFAPGDVARADDKAAVDKSRAAYDKYAADKRAWEAQQAKGRQQTGDYQAQRDATLSEQNRLNAEADQWHAERTAIYNQQQARFLNKSGVRISESEYVQQFGRKPPPEYYEAAPVRPEPKTAHIPPTFRAPEYPEAAPEILEMRPDAHYESLNNNYFASLKKGDPDKVLNVQALQDIRKATYDMIRFENFGSRAVDVKLRDTGHIFGDTIKQVFTNADTSLGQQYATQWALKDEQYSAAQLLKSALRKGGDTTSFSGLIDKIVSAGAIGLAVGSTGFMGGPLAAAKASASYKAIQNIRPEHFFHFGKAMGQVLGQADKKLAGAVMQNLRNTPAVLTNYYSPAKYQEMGSKLSMIAQDPTKSASNINQALTGAGVPSDMADDMTGKLHAQNMYLTEQLQQQTGPADMVSQGHGDPVKLRKIMGQYQTMQNPTHGITYPTQANLEVLKKFYPNTLLTAQQAVYQQLRRNPKMAPKVKQWASRLLGRPINNLSSPGFSAMLQQSRAASQQAQQQLGGGTAQPKRRNSDDDVGSETRLDELQGGG